MTGEQDRERMLDAVSNIKARGLKYKDIKFKLQSEGKLNPGTQKALDSVFNKLVLKNGTTISRSARGQIIIQKKSGEFRKQKGFERFIKKFKEMEKK